MVTFYKASTTRVDIAVITVINVMVLTVPVVQDKCYENRGPES